MSVQSSPAGTPLVESHTTGNGATTPPKDDSGGWTGTARFREEFEALRLFAAGHEAELDNLSRRKDEILAIAAHDLKTPLTSILAYAQFAARLLTVPAPDVGKVEQALAVIEDQSRTMSLLLDDLLDASHIEMGAFEMWPANCDLCASLNAVLTRLEPDEHGRIDVAVSHTSMEGQWDQRQVEQVLANLIGNALKYSPHDTRVNVVATRSDAGIEVAVTDHGMGLLEGDSQHVFERFHRTQRARASGLAGHGLGLYICHAIVTAHGGKLWAESAGEDRGATFRFTLPCFPIE